METKNIKSALAGAMETARRLLFGEACCAACGADVFSQEYFCGHCLQTLPFNAGFVCGKCGRAVGEDYPVCLECKADMPLFDAARSVFRYEGEIVRLVKKFKTGGRYLADAFAQSMLQYLLSDFAGADILAFVPMTVRAERGPATTSRACSPNGSPPCRASRSRKTHWKRRAKRPRRNNSPAANGRKTCAAVFTSLPAKSGRERRPYSSTTFSPRAPLRTNWRGCSSARARKRCSCSRRRACRSGAKNRFRTKIERSKKGKKRIAGVINMKI